MIGEPSAASTRGEAIVGPAVRVKSGARMAALLITGSMGPPRNPSRSPSAVGLHGDRIPGVVVTAGDRRVLLAGQQVPAAEDRAVGLDVRIAEVDVAAND